MAIETFPIYKGILQNIRKTVIKVMLFFMLKLIRLLNNNWQYSLDVNYNLKCFKLKKYTAFIYLCAENANNSRTTLIFSKETMMAYGYKTSLNSLLSKILYFLYTDHGMSQNKTGFEEETAFQMMYPLHALQN